MVTRRLSSALLALGADAAHLLRQRPPCDSMRRCSRHSFATRAAWREGEPAPRAAAVVIGNEVLSGKIQDTNSAWLARLLYSRGVDMCRMVTIPDDRREIIETVKAMSSLVGPNGFVFTSGGIGPTHDDVTYEAIASAFGTELELHPPTVARMRAHYEAQGKELNTARLRMATLPKGSTVHVTPNVWVPLAQLHNVLILPGVPWLYKSMLEANKELFKGPLMTTVTLYTARGEGDLAAALTDIANAHPLVSIGSYPNTSTSDQSVFKTKLCFDGRDKEALDAAVAAVREAIPTFETLPPPAAA